MVNKIKLEKEISTREHDLSKEAQVNEKKILIYYYRKYIPIQLIRQRLFKIFL